MQHCSPTNLKVQHQHWPSTILWDTIYEYVEVYRYQCAVWWCFLMRAPYHHPHNVTQRGVSFPDGVPFLRHELLRRFHRHHLSRQATPETTPDFRMNICCSITAPRASQTTGGGRRRKRTRVEFCSARKIRRPGFLPFWNGCSGPRELTFP